MVTEAKVLAEHGKEQFSEDVIQLRDQLFNSFAPDPVSSDQVFQYANALFLSDKKAWHWLGKHCPALAARPFDLLHTTEGCGRVMQVLFAVYHSVYL